MLEALDLNGEWSYLWTEFQGGTDALPPLEVVRKRWSRRAQVPGDVHLDLMREGLIPDPFVGMNADHALWVEQKDWWFRREFESPSGLAGRRAVLVFHGLDHFATVWVNGHVVGRSDNMFIRHEFDVTDALKADGRNELVVRLAASAWSIHTDDSGGGPGSWNRERIFCRKAQMSFGWDIAPRLVTVGLWRPVELLLIDRGRITTFHVVLKRFEGHAAVVGVEIEVQWTEAHSGVARLSGTVHGTVWETKAELQPGRNVVTRELRLENAPRWWPIGYGTPALVEASVSLEFEGSPLDARRIRTGLRRVELIQEPQPSGATSFGFRVNGRDIFITGLNWTPLDAIFARVTPERITHTLEKLAKIGCNMVRVWGGGVYESEHFYRECDRLGIMVWQDFMMTCDWYPQSDAFASALETEARQVVRDLRSHPCVAVWAGDNECDAALAWVGLDGKVGVNRLTRDVLPRVCRELSPEVPYVPSSPWSPSGAHVDSQTEGDYHGYAHGQDYRKSYLWDVRCRFMSEFGRLSLPSMKVIRKYFPKGTEWPLTGAMWSYHGSDTTRDGRFRVADKILAELEASGRPAPTNIRETVRASQELQAEGVVALIERYCDDPEFGGFLLWNVADCWPQQSDAVMDCDGNAKTVFRKLGPLFRKVRAARSGGSR